MLGSQHVKIKICELNNCVFTFEHIAEVSRKCLPDPSLVVKVLNLLHVPHKLLIPRVTFASRKGTLKRQLAKKRRKELLVIKLILKHLLVPTQSSNPKFGFNWSYT